MVENAMSRPTIHESPSKSVYYNPQHTWGSLDEHEIFTFGEVAENVSQNENELRNVLRPIQAFSESN